eukprot:Rmarinus@m.7021
MFGRLLHDWVPVQRVCCRWRRVGFDRCHHPAARSRHPLPCHARPPPVLASRPYGHPAAPCSNVLPAARVGRHHGELLPGLRFIEFQPASLANGVRLPVRVLRA